MAMELRVTLRKLIRVTSSIRLRLVLLALALALPIAAYSVFVSIDDAATERAHVGHEMYGRAQVVAARLDDQVNDVKAILSVLSVEVSVDPRQTADNDALLRGVAPQLPAHIDNLTVWALDGTNVGSIDPALHKASYSKVAVQRMFQGNSNGVSMTVQAPLRSSIKGAFIAAFRLPIHRDGRLVGAVGASISLSSLQTLLDTGVKLPPEAVMTIVTNDGVVLARSVDQERWVGRRVKGPASAPTVGKTDAGGIRNGPSADGIDRVGGLAVAHATPWRVYVGVPKNIALRAVHERLIGHLVSALVVSLLGCVLAIKIGEGIVAPLRELIQDAARLGKGDLDHRSAVRTHSEIGALVRTLNQMAEQLQHRSESLASSERRSQLIADNVPALITYIDRDERYRFANRFLGDVFNLDPTRILGQTMRAAGGEKLYTEISPRISAALKGERVVFEGQWTVAERTYSYQSTYVPDVSDDGTVDGFYAMTFDITALKQTQRELDQLARQDVLTGLPNRREFAARLNVAMARCRRTSRPMALIFLDVDRFKQINDSYGHGGGDTVLIELARRLTDTVRTTDTVARLAGDEFVLILEGLNSSSEVSSISEKLGHNIRTPMRLGHANLVVTASIGVASYDGVDGTAEELIERADRALYRAKEAGRDTYAATAFTELV